MLQDACPQQAVQAIDHDSYHLGVFEDYADYIVHQERIPKVLVVPINLRSFASPWDKSPMTQFAKEKVILRGVYPCLRPLFQPLLVFKAFDLEPISEQESRAAPVYFGETQIGVVGDYNFRNGEATATRVKDRFAFNYTYVLSPCHRKVQSMVAVGPIVNRQE